MSTRRLAVIALLALALLPVAANAATGAAQLSPVESEIFKFFQYADTASVDLSRQFISADGLGILAACVAIRILMIVVPATIDGDLSSLAGDGIKVVVGVFLVLTLFANWNGGVLNVRARVNGAVGEMTSLETRAAPTAQCGASELDPGTLGNQGIAGVVGYAIGGFNCSSNSVLDATFATFAIKSKSGGILGFVGDFGIQALVVLLGLVAVLILLVVFIVVTLEALLSWAHLIIPLTFGPLVLAFFPINSRWSKNVATEIAAGIVGYAASLFVLLIVIVVFVRAGTDLQTLASTYNQSGSGVSDLSKSMLGEMGGLALVGILMAFAGRGFVASAMRLVEGVDSFGQHRGAAAGFVGRALMRGKK